MLFVYKPCTKNTREDTNIVIKNLLLRSLVATEAFHRAQSWTLEAFQVLQDLRALQDLPAQGPGCYWEAAPSCPARTTRDLEAPFLAPLGGSFEGSLDSSLGVLKADTNKFSGFNVFPNLIIKN